MVLFSLNLHVSTGYRPRQSFILASPLLIRTIGCTFLFIFNDKRAQGRSKKEEMNTELCK